VIDADTSRFELDTPPDENAKQIAKGKEDPLAFKTQNVNAHVDFSSEVRKGQFKSNGAESFVEFPANQYICYMDIFNWYMDNGDIELESSKRQELVIDSDLDLTGSNFWSVHPDQDSLNFMSSKAKYNIKKKQIICSEVPYVGVADAKIEPDSGYVIIEKKAHMKKFENATIIANALTQYHKIFNAEVEISSRKEYLASGDYNYVDANKNSHLIHFSKIAPDTAYQTYAKGEIEESEGFKLSPQFDYKGAVELLASQQNLVYTGFLKIAHSCGTITREWVSFSEEVVPDEIYIPLGDTIVNDKGDPVVAGLLIDPDTTDFINRIFLSEKRKRSIPEIVTASGYLFYDKADYKYKISNKEKLIERSIPGNYVDFNTKDCAMHGEGKLSFGCDFGVMKATPVGTVDYTTAGKSTTMNTSVLLDFFINENAMKKMAELINGKPDLDPFDPDPTKSVYEMALKELTGEETAEKMISDLTIEGAIKKMPKELEVPLFLSDVKFEWDSGEEAFMAKGKIGISNIGKEQVFKYVDGIVIIKKRRNGDKFKLYLQVDEKTWYYFSYQNELMRVKSSDDGFNSIISATKEDKTKTKEGKNKYQYILEDKNSNVVKVRRLLEE